MTTDAVSGWSVERIEDHSGDSLSVGGGLERPRPTPFSMGPRWNGIVGVVIGGSPTHSGGTRRSTVRSGP